MFIILQIIHLKIFEKYHHSFENKIFKYRLLYLSYCLSILILNIIILRIKAFLAKNNSTFIVYKCDKCCIFCISVGYLMILTKTRRFCAVAAQRKYETRKIDSFHVLFSMLNINFIGFETSSFLKKTRGISFHHPSSG